MQPLRSLELTSALQKLIAIMQRTGFGKVCGLQLINGQPQFQPAPLVLQDWKLGGSSASGTLDGAAGANAQRIQLLTLPLGAHTFVASAADTAGNTALRSVTFHIVATIQSLTAIVNAYGAQGKIDPATTKSLLAKLNDAQVALNRGRKTDVRHKLSDFIGVCNRRVTADVASRLIADAQYVLGTL